MCPLREEAREKSVCRYVNVAASPTNKAKAEAEATRAAVRTNFICYRIDLKRKKSSEYNEFIYAKDFQSVDAARTET